MMILNKVYINDKNNHNINKSDNHSFSEINLAIELSLRLCLKTAFAKPTTTITAIGTPDSTTTITIYL